MFKQTKFRGSKLQCQCILKTIIFTTNSIIVNMHQPTYSLHCNAVYAYLLPLAQYNRRNAEVFSHRRQC